MAPFTFLSQMAFLEASKFTENRAEGPANLPLGMLSNARQHI